VESSPHTPPPPSPLPRSPLHPPHILYPPTRSAPPLRPLPRPSSQAPGRARCRAPQPVPERGRVRAAAVGTSNRPGGRAAEWMWHPGTPSLGLPPPPHPTPPFPSRAPPHRKGGRCGDVVVAQNLAMTLRAALAEPLAAFATSGHFVSFEWRALSRRGPCIWCFLELPAGLRPVGRHARREI
jgi:hypothetical protein